MCNIETCGKLYNLSATISELEEQLDATRKELLKCFSITNDPIFTDQQKIVLLVELVEKELCKIHELWYNTEDS